MRITGFSIERFRSFDRIGMQNIDARVTAFQGPNGSGKTNILEAIGFLSLGISCLGADMENVVRWGHGHCRIRAHIRTRDDEKTLEVIVQTTPRRQKAFFTNDVRTPHARFLGQFPSVIFLPEDLALFGGGPARRRTFLDALLMQTSPEFMQTAREYDKVIKQRNQLLKAIKHAEAKESDLGPWDERIAVLGAKIMLHRSELIEVLHQDFASHIEELGECFNAVAINYITNTEGVSEQVVVENLHRRLIEFRPRDIVIGVTTVGPHRDDWQLMADGRDIATFASRGQQRTALLALLFRQVAFLEAELREKPIVLLDDVFSELDERHQGLLLQHLIDSQVFLTTTHLPPNTAVDIWTFEGNGAIARP